MGHDIYTQLKDIGISEELAHQVDKALSPEHVATKQDLLVMQEAMLQSQLKTDTRYMELSNKIDRVDSKVDRIHTDLNGKIDRVHTDLNGKIDRVDSTLRVEIAAISRQFWITFGGLITTILSVFTVNWYFH